MRGDTVPRGSRWHVMMFQLTRDADGARGAMNAKGGGRLGAVAAFV